MQRIVIPGPPVIKIEEKLVPVPVVVVKEIEITKFVPFEPTPPGFGPVPDWSIGMPINPAYTRIFTSLPKISKKFVWTRRKTTNLFSKITTTFNPINSIFLDK